MKTPTAAQIVPFVPLTPEVSEDYAALRELLEIFRQLSRENKHVVIGFCRGELRDQQKTTRDANARDFINQLVTSAERDRRRFRQDPGRP